MVAARIRVALDLVRVHEEDRLVGAEVERRSVARHYDGQLGRHGLEYGEAEALAAIGRHVHVHALVQADHVDLAQRLLHVDDLGSVAELDHLEQELVRLVEVVDRVDDERHVVLARERRGEGAQEYVEALALHDARVGEELKALARRQAVLVHVETVLGQVDAVRQHGQLARVHAMVCQCRAAVVRRRPHLVHVFLEKLEPSVRHGVIFLK